MIKRKIIVQFAFTVEEAAIARAKNPGAILCDAQNASFIDFNDAEIFAGKQCEKTEWLVAKAKGENPKPPGKAKAK